VTAAIAVGVLVAGGVYLILQRGLLRVVLGFVLLGHGVNVLLVAAGGMDRRGVPLIGQVDPAEAADPLPQAFVLTAIVITFGITVFLLGLLRARAAEDGPGAPADPDEADDPDEPGSPRVPDSIDLPEGGGTPAAGGSEDRGAR
jgi:multicomponent Na+:H+ antiporter subunit C